MLVKTAASDGVTQSINGLSEMPMREMFRAWSKYMTEGRGKCPLIRSSCDPFAGGERRRTPSPDLGVLRDEVRAVSLPAIRMSGYARLGWMAGSLRSDRPLLDTGSSQYDPSPDGRPTMYCEDRYLMRMRIKRLRNPKAWSQLPPHRTSHVVSNISIVDGGAYDGAVVVVQSRFHMVELRWDKQRYLAGRYRHHLIRADGDFKVSLQKGGLVEL